MAIVPSIDIRYTYVNNFSTLVSKDDTIELIDSAGNTRDLTYECDVHAMASEEDKYRIMLNELAIYIENENLCISRL